MQALQLRCSRWCSLSSRGMLAYNRLADFAMRGVGIHTGSRRDDEVHDERMRLSRQGRKRRIGAEADQAWYSLFLCNEMSGRQSSTIDASTTSDDKYVVFAFCAAYSERCQSNDHVQVQTRSGVQCLLRMKRAGVPGMISNSSSFGSRCLFRWILLGDPAGTRRGAHSRPAHLHGTGNNCMGNLWFNFEWMCLRHSYRLITR